LAGGRATRMGGIEKPLIKFRGKYLISHPLEVLSEVCDEIIISCRDEHQKRLLSGIFEGFKFSTDIFKNMGPLGGIHAAFMEMTGDYGIVVACDMPFIQREIVVKLFEVAEGYDASMPVWENGKFEPLFAVYRKHPFLQEVEKSLKKGESKILAPVFRLKNVRYISVNDLRNIDPEFRSFININTYYDLNRIGGC